MVGVFAPSTAIVREVSPRLGAAELTYLDRTPVDVDRAREQHRDYCRALTDLGLEVVATPPAPEHPDGVFVEDALVVVGDLGIVTRPGAASRRGEVASITPLLGGLGLRRTDIAAPATLDGGDVLQVGPTVYVGRSSRTNAAAIDQLRALLEPTGRRVTAVEVPGALHLKTAATALPDGTILAVPDWVDTGAFDARQVIAAPEPTGADVLLVGDTVVVSASAPRTADFVAARGWPVVTVAIDEFERVEAGPTCLSVLVPDPAATLRGIDTGARTY